MMPPTHEKWMAHAMELAWKGRYQTSPNPMVGACVVKKDRLISSGYHASYGAPHAEFVALQKAGTRAQGAVLYVTLEPCSSWGKTPPCTDRVIASGIREVVMGCLDPNPVHHGAGVALLRKKGIRVKVGICESAIREQNAYFFKWIRTGMPWVTLKMAQTLDGKIASASGSSRWITSPASRCFVHELRAEQDAIMVGARTLKLDNPRLTPHLRPVVNRPGRPWRIVLDTRCQASVRANVFQGDAVTVRVVSERYEKKISKIQTARNAGNFIFVPEKDGCLDLREILKKLGSLGIAKLLVEGGGELAWSFLKEERVDKIIWMVAPKFLGGRDAKTSVEGKGFANPDKALPLDIQKVTCLGNDWVFEGALKRSSKEK